LAQARTAVTLAHRDRVSALVYSADGRRILSGANDMLVRLWDVHSGQELKVLSGHAAMVTSVALSRDERFAASGSADKTVRLWDLRSSLPSRRSPGHSALVTALAFAPDGNWFVSASEDFTIRIWDSASGEELRVLSGHGARVSSLAIAPDGRSIVSTSGDDTIRIWDAESGRQNAVLQAGSPNMHSIQFIADGRRIICAEGGRLNVCEAASRTKLFEVPSFGSHRTSYAIAPGDATAAVATNEAAEMRVWDPQQEREVTYQLRDPSIAGPMVTLWDLSRGKELLRLRAHEDSVDAIAFHPGGKQLVTASSDQAIIWDVGRGEPIGRLWGITNSLNQLAYSADGAHIIGGHEASDTVWIWPSDGGAPLTSVSGFGRFRAVAAWEANPGSAQAYVENDETVVAPGKASTDVARFPVALTLLTPHPSVRSGPALWDVMSIS
jgi:WD40 repeat protein